MDTTDTKISASIRTGRLIKTTTTTINATMRPITNNINTKTNKNINNNEYELSNSTTTHSIRENANNTSDKHSLEPTECSNYQSNNSPKSYTYSRIEHNSICTSSVDIQNSQNSTNDMDMSTVSNLIKNKLTQDETNSNQHTTTNEMTTTTKSGSSSDNNNRSISVARTKNTVNEGFVASKVAALNKKIDGTAGIRILANRMEVNRRVRELNGERPKQKKPARTAKATQVSQTAVNHTECKQANSTTTVDDVNCIQPCINQADDRQKSLTFETSERSNDRWGDTIDAKEENTTRIYFQNINSLSLSTKNDKLKSVMKCCNEQNCDILGLAETNANWKRRNLRQQTRLAARQWNKHSSIAFSNNKTVADDYLPGGTMQMATGQWSCRIEKELSDENNKGRWSGHKYRLQEDKSIFVLTAYRCCKQTAIETTTPLTASNQQIIISREMGIDNPIPRRDFYTDLEVHFKNWNILSTDYVLLMLDANEQIGDDAQGLTKTMERLNLIDVFERHHKTSCKVPTFHRGTKRIDYMLCSNNLLQHVDSAGYLPFYQGMRSDHRGAFLDIKNTIINNNINPKGRQDRHISTSSRLKDLVKYKQYIQLQFTNHNIHEKAKALYDEAKDNEDNEEFLYRLNKLDEEITLYCLAAEQKIAPTTRSTTKTSYNAQRIVHYWQIKAKGVINNINVKPQLDEIYNSLPDEWKARIDYNAKAPRSAIRSAKKEHKLIIKQEMIEQQESAMVDIQRVAETEGCAPEQIVLQRNYKSMTKKTFREIRVHLKPATTQGLSTIEVPDKDKNSNPTDDPDEAATWKRITDPVEVENRLLQRNEQHFRQAQGTAFTISPIVDQLQYEGNVAITSLQAPNEPIAEGVRLLFKKLTDGNHLRGIDDDINYEEFEKGFKCWPEETSTSPSGRHLGHYKALLVPDGLPKEKSNEITTNEPTTSTKIMLVYFHMVMAGIRSGSSLTRWQRSTTTMIEKIPGSPRINKLRVIHLYEADYNLALKLLWARKLVWNAHTLNQLHDGQAGSRPGKRCIDVVVHKEMKYLYATLTRTGVATMDNDAKSCYDRIICNLAMMVSKYFGMSDRACKTHSTTLKLMQFKLRTALGDSDAHYKHGKETPIHGSGQGSCASPCLWLLISSILMDCLKEAADGMTMADVKSINTIEQWIEGFVDDTSLFSNTVSITDKVGDLKMSLSKDMNLWAQLLEATGGRLELSKCFYYILSWNFALDGTPYPQTIAEQNLSPITVHDSINNTTTEIRQEEVTTPHKTLGVMKTMVGDETEHMKTLQKKSSNMALMVSSAPLTRHQARVAYNSVYSPMMTYSLPACSYTENELGDMQSSAVGQFLPKMGYDRTFPRAVVFGPREAGGLNLTHMYTEQGSQKVKTLLEHVRSESGMGNLMRYNLNWLQLHSGRSTPLLESNDEVKYLDKNWLLHARTFMIDIDTQLKIQHAWTPSIEREGDACLMDRFATVKIIQSLARKMNYWRLYLQVNTISDICNAEGTHVKECYRKFHVGEHWKDIRRSKLNWPKQIS
jgi:hypothetical protein